MDLNAEQKRIAFQDPKGHSLLRGVAGSGKTSVGIYRIPFLLNNYCFAKDDAILIATFNRTLIAYMGHLYNKIESKESAEFNSLFGTPDRNVDIKTVDSLVYQYFQQYSEENKLNIKVGIEKAASYEIINEGITKLKKQFPGIIILDHKNTTFLLEEISWIKDCMYLEEEEYQSADRIGKVRLQGEGGPQRLLKNSEARKAIFELMLFYGDKLKKCGLISFSDMRLLAIEQVKKRPGQKYTHIIVDESQDLTRTQLLFLKAIYNEKDYSSFFFIADTTQSIYPQAWLGSGRSFASIGFNMVGKSQALSKNYRTTTQISEAAYSLIEECPEIVEDENFVKPALIDKQGEYPVFKILDNEKVQAEFIGQEIAGLLDTVSAKDIAVIARFKNQLDVVRQYFNEKGIHCDFYSEKDTNFETERIKLITMHSIKGLEFQVVFTIGLDERAIPYFSSSDPERREEELVKERRLLYVGMTRATEYLYLLSSSTPSKFISEINNRFLKINRISAIRQFYRLPIDKYHFKEKIQNIHANEEKIRQWVIAELLKTYNYPLQCLSVEYPVKEFSRKGFVDIAVSVEKEDHSGPLIFIETKQPGHSIDDALNQVKSYMSHCKTCQYGVATDGRDFAVIDHTFKPVSDIPFFKDSWNASSMRQFRYSNLKTGVEHKLSFDENDPSSLEVYNHERTEFFEGHNVARLPVYGKIAAGVPIHMNSEIDDLYYFPKTWFRGAEHFVLKVRGDSMENAGIVDGDFVVIRKQGTAENLEIAVVAVNEDATLKRFRWMGENVLLLAENPKYDPILMQPDQVSVLGVAVGIIKPTRKNHA